MTLKYIKYIPLLIFKINQLRATTDISIFHILSTALPTTSGNCCNFIAHFTHSENGNRAMEWVFRGALLLFQANAREALGAGSWELGADSFILTSLCVFAILNIFLITSSRTQRRERRAESRAHIRTHTYGNTNISSQFAAVSRQRTANKIIRQNVCGALYALLFGSPPGRGRERLRRVGDAAGLQYIRICTRYDIYYIYYIYIYICW